MQLSPKTRIGELIKTYPFLLDYLAGYAPEFEKLRNPILRNTFGRVATLKMAATMGKVPLDRLLEDLRQTITNRSGEAPEVVLEDGGDEASGRLELLKGIIRDLHAGTPMEELKLRFAALLEHVDPTEIAHMEQQLMAEGLPQEEIKRLCDVHVQVFKAALEAQKKPETLPGHPVHTFTLENRALERVAEQLRAHVQAVQAAEGGRLPTELGPTLEELAQIERHYLRKENQLFPFLEGRGIVGPPQVMWAIHDEVRALLKKTRAAANGVDRALLLQSGPELVQKVLDMIYKEDNILFPMSLQVLDESDWREIRRGESEIGYALVTPGTEWPAPPPVGQPAATTAPPATSRIVDRLPLDTGLLTLEQVNLLLKHLPVDVTFVDENDEVRYYSEGPVRIFPRSPGVIGRKVQNCHPPKSLAMVNRILDEFRSGTKDVAEFWIDIQGRFVHIRYFALRDTKGSYRGTLEVTQDVTSIRALEGQRRLLDWGSPEVIR
jgi:hypothetical protein